MNTRPMDQLSECLSVYSAIVAAYQRSPIDTTRDPDDAEHPIRDTWHDDHYLAVGCEAVQIIVRVLLANLRQPPLTILDFACGSGRVTRHLRAMFPDARIAACDVGPGHVAFCEQQFGAEPMMSNIDFDQVEIRPEWDLVFCGSLLTHLPERLFWPSIRFISRGLTPTGIAMVTLAGRRSEHLQDHCWKLIEDQRFERIRRAYRHKGFGFADYTGHVRRLFPRQERYGIALVKPSWVMSGLELMREVRILGYVERAWDDHQDLVVFGRPGAAS